jgi:hypothetical protein
MLQKGAAPIRWRFRGETSSSVNPGNQPERWERHLAKTMHSTKQAGLPQGLVRMDRNIGTE